MSQNQQPLRVNQQQTATNNQTEVVQSNQQDQDITKSQVKRQNHRITQANSQILHKNQPWLEQNEQNQDIKVQQKTQKKVQQLPSIKAEEEIETTLQLKDQPVSIKSEDAQTKQSVQTISTQILKPQSKKDKQSSKKVEITKKQLKQYLKFATDCQNFKKQTQEVKKSYNKVAKELISTREQLQKKSFQLKQHINQVKQCHQKISKIENQYALLAKKMKQEQRNSQKQAGLQETIKQLQKIINVSTTNQQVFQRELEKHKQILRIQKQMNVSLKVEVQELRHVSSEYFLLKQQVSRLSNQLKSLKDAKEQYPKMVQKYEHQQQINQKLKQTIKQLQTKISVDKTFIQRLQKKLDKMNEDKKNLEKKLITSFAQKEERQGEIEAFKMQLQDQRTEIEVQRKRYTAEIKDLKLALHHEHEKLKITQTQLEESRKKQKKTVKLQGVKFSSLSKEDLFNLIQQLQMKNASIMLNLNSLLEEISSKDRTIAQLHTTLMSLTRHIVKALPNFDQSQGMVYVQKQVIQMGKGKKEDWPQIVEKVVIQNLRLKNSVTTLGEQFNMRMRQESQKMGK